MQQALDSGWSYNVLHQMIKTKAHLRQGAAITNFRETLPPPQSDLARQALKDPFIFDFLTLDTTFREQELEAGLLGNLQRFLLELGKGFAFVGRQYPIRPYSRLARRTEIGTADHRGDRANTWPAQ
jgi:predicted nuclease of restriction endonuclease-like (RecB) superfamily